MVQLYAMQEADEKLIINVRVYIIITIVRSYTGKYHKFVAVCIAPSAQHE